jgi:hypothetical protein
MRDHISFEEGRRGSAPGSAPISLIVLYAKGECNDLKSIIVSVRSYMGIHTSVEGNLPPSFNICSSLLVAVLFISVPDSFR